MFSVTGATARAFTVDGDTICAGCVIETQATGFTRVTVANTATCDWCDTEHGSLMAALAVRW